MQDDERAIREFAALLEADVRVSGARTVGEIKEALNEAIESLLSPPEFEFVTQPSTEVEKDKRMVKMTMSVRSPRLPG